MADSKVSALTLVNPSVSDLVYLAQAQGTSPETYVSKATTAAALSANFRGAAVTLTGNLTSQNLTSFLAINFDSEVIDTDGFHANSPNPERFTIPAALNGATVMATGGVYYTGGAGSLSCQTFLGHKNSGGTTLHAARAFSYATTSGGGSAVLITTVSTGDYFYLSLSDGATTDATIYATNTRLELTVLRELAV